MNSVIGLSLYNFKSKVKDLARGNRFEVQITPPPSYDGYTDSQFNLLSWLAETAQIPARTQGEVSIKFHGMEYKLLGDFAKENLTISFINSYGWEGRDFFELWMEYIQSKSTDNSRLSSFDMMFGSTIIVNQLGRKNGEILASYKFNDVFPTNITAIDLNMSENDSVEKFTVSFAYSYYDSLVVDKKVINV